MRLEKRHVKSTRLRHHNVTAPSGVPRRDFINSICQDRTLARSANRMNNLRPSEPQHTQQKLSD